MVQTPDQANPSTNVLTKARQTLDVGVARQAQFFARVRYHLARRLPAPMQLWVYDSDRRFTLVAGLACVAMAGGVGYLALAQDVEPPVVAQAPEPTDLPHIDDPFAPSAFRDLSREEAMALNAAEDGKPVVVPAATSFVITSGEATDYQRSVQCLTQAIYYEAGNEGIDGGRAVAQVVLNRVRHPAYPDNVCGVVFEGAKRTTGCQFTFACDGSLARVPNERLWKQARAIAINALAGDVFGPVGWSTHYHANYVVPYWASSLEKTATIGAHIFYRWSGNWGKAGAFNRRYAGAEPQAELLVASELLAAGDSEDAPAAGADTVAEVPKGRPVLIGQGNALGAVSVRTGGDVREVSLDDRKILLPNSGAATGAGAAPTAP